MSSYGQTGAKRQKVREARENVDYFQGIEKVEYNNRAPPADTSSYRHFHGAERLHSRAMDDWLKFSVSLTDFRNCGFDNHRHTSQPRPWDDQTNTIENHKRCIKAVYDLCTKLGVKYFTAFDSDLVPFTDSWEENKAHWDDIVEYIQDLSQRHHVKPLWIAPDLHSHPRYYSGAFTSNEVTTFTQAATQIKRCLENSQRLNAECFLLWPYREGYQTIFQTDVAREIKLFAKLLKMTAEYKDRLSYRCQLLIMPYYRHNFGGWQHSQWREADRINAYMCDVTSCLYLLKSHSLERHYKVCAVPGHHMYMADVYNMLGGVTVTAELDHCDGKTLALMLKCILEHGTPPVGGINLRLSPGFSDPREVATTYVKYIDAVARGLRQAGGLVAEQVFSKYLQQRYVSYCTGFGSRLITADVSMEECEEYYKKHHTHGDLPASKHEHLDIVFQRHLDACEHV